MKGTWRTRIAVAAVAALVVGACGGTASAPTALLGASPGATQGTGGGGGGGGGGSGGNAPSSSASDVNIFPFSIPPQTPWPAVGGKARVVDIYDPLIEPAFPVDVLQTGFITVSKPLLTVQPGTASDYFDPGDEGDGGTDLAFYRSGSTKSDDQVMEQGWNAMKGKQITIVLMTSGTQQTDPNNPSATLTERALGADYVVEERGGTNPRPSPESGKGILWIDTQPLNEIPFGKGWTAPAIGTGDGNCLLALGDSGPAGYSFIQGQQGFSLPPGPVSLNVYDPVSMPDQCKGKPVFGPIQAHVQAGAESVVIFYGLDKDHLKTLSLPIGS
jgi:hypothetical protein